MDNALMNKLLFIKLTVYWGGETFNKGATVKIRGSRNCETNLITQRCGDHDEHLHSFVFCSMSKNIPFKCASPRSEMWSVCGPDQRLQLSFFSSALFLEGRILVQLVQGTDHPWSTVSSLIWYLSTGEYRSGAHNLCTISQWHQQAEPPSLAVLDHSSSVVSRAGLQVLWSHQLTSYLTLLVYK